MHSAVSPASQIRFLRWLHPPNPLPLSPPPVSESTSLSELPHFESPPSPSVLRIHLLSCLPSTSFISLRSRNLLPFLHFRPLNPLSRPLLSVSQSTSFLQLRPPNPLPHYLRPLLASLNFTFSVHLRSLYPLFPSHCNTYIHSYPFKKFISLEVDGELHFFAIPHFPSILTCKSTSPTGPRPLNPLLTPLSNLVLYIQFTSI